MDLTIQLTTEQHKRLEDEAGLAEIPIGQYARDILLTGQRERVELLVALQVLPELHRATLQVAESLQKVLNTDAT